MQLKFSGIARGAAWQQIATLAFLSLSITSKVDAAYLQTNLVANNTIYNPQLVDPLLQGSRSIAIRPAGLGGHFWINNISNGTNTVYVGDVAGISIFQDELQFITIPSSPNNPSALSSPTGQVFNSSTEFVISQNHPNGTINGPSKFLFASLDGTVTAWTDRKKAVGIPDWPLDSVIVIDRYGSSRYQGIAVSNLPNNNRLYVADFGENPGIEVFDGDFQEISSDFSFVNPFAIEGYAAYNVQIFDNSLYVTYAKPSRQQLGEAESQAGGGKLAQFDLDGNLIAIWDDFGLLNVPAGLAIAPVNFGKFSNHLLVANFGDGTIVAFDPQTRQALGVIEDERGNPLSISGIWGLTFGNGASLGEKNHLYFSATPQNNPNDGLFGKLQPIPESNFIVALMAFSLGCSIRSRLKK
jgi:uncharacterized protein (TIGR03118 family)